VRIQNFFCTVDKLVERRCLRGNGLDWTMGHWSDLFHLELKAFVVALIGGIGISEGSCIVIFG
jgi:hypothetical protein